MPRRDDLHTILVIGSGPIVIGQACEFDYSGTQACRVLAEEGYRVVLANSNPATIMTDPATADRTYVEPLDAEVLAAIIEQERPDALLPTLGGQTALNLTMELVERGVLERFGVEVIGARPEAIATAEDRTGSSRPWRRSASRCRVRASPTRSKRRRRSPRRSAIPIMVRPSFILGGKGTGIAEDAARSRPARRRGPGRQPGRPDPRRAVDRRLEGVRARGDARRRRQLRRRLLHRELRPDGRAHRRLHHRRAGPDADRRRVPGDARRRVRLPAQGRRRDRRVQRAVRGRPRDGAPGHHRDEPAGVALLGAGVQSDRLPDRQDRGPPRGRVPAQRDPQRHHEGDAGVVRAHDRLRRDQGPALGLREVARR